MEGQKRGQEEWDVEKKLQCLTFSGFKYPEMYWKFCNFKELVKFRNGRYDGYLSYFGLEPGAQWNFLHNAPFEHKYMGILMTKNPKDFELEVDGEINPFDPSVAAWVFGEISNGKCELWYVGVNKFNKFVMDRLDVQTKLPKWGPIGLDKVNGTKVTWRSSTTKTNISNNNFTSQIIGRGNPYAVFALYKFCIEAVHIGVTRIIQPNLPCANLFHKDYSHKNHPGIFLVYNSLSFQYFPDAGFQMVGHNQQDLYEHFKFSFSEYEKTLTSCPMI
jgi:hypothetical protein